MSSYRVDFGKPIALFPLPGVSLLPHGAQPLHIFEPKYRQMVERCLASGNGDLERADPIAMAVIDARKSAGVEEVSLCEAVCVGRIARVEQLRVADSIFCFTACAEPESTSSTRPRTNGFIFEPGFGQSNRIFSRLRRFLPPAGRFAACSATLVFDDWRRPAWRRSGSIVTICPPAWFST